ncbi:MAG: bifunctional riboflavin kinase/FAD synthetase [Chloroflexota bacterium]
MKHLYNLASAQLTQPSVVTIGVFDGVHLGHQHLIKRLVDEARASNRLAVALTFFPHPDVLLRGLSGRYYLTTPEQRADYLGDLGIDTVITLPFNDEFRQIRAAAFVDMLIEHLKLSSLRVGSDFALGYQREGNVDFLRAQGEAKGFSVQVIDMIVAETDGAISSTAIREALLAGEVEKARDWLGRSYSLTGEVVHGDHRGRELGFPTANMHVWEEQVIPANGIYAGWATLGDERFMAATSVGVRPHFDGEDVRVEAYLLDFDRDIYGKQLTFTFERYLRPEMKFDSLEALIDQINADVHTTREYLTQL